MLYTVSEISELIGLSKVSLYKKLKSKEFDEHIIKKQGTSFIDEIGFNLIKEGLKDLKSEESDNTSNDETVADEEDLTTKTDYINTLKRQLDVKDKQITELHKLIENNQVLLKEKPQDFKLLEEHFTELDDKLMDLKDKMEIPQKGFFEKLFKK